MSSEVLRRIDAETVQEIKENLAYLQKIADSPTAGKRLKKQCLKNITHYQKYVAAIETGEIYKKAEYCEYCGEPYNPEWTLLHGDKHLFFTVKQFDKKTGVRIR